MPMLNDNNFECDFCGIIISNDGEGSAFVDGSAFSNVGEGDDRIACESCICFLDPELSGINEILAEENSNA